MKQTLFSLLALLLMTTTSLYAGTLDDVKKRGSINCGVSEGLPGFGSELASGSWEGFDVDFCRALSAAVFGSPQRVKYIPLNSKKRFSTLAAGEIDVLSRNSTWTFARDTNLGLNFAGVSFYDGQGFMVKKSLRVKKAKDLNGATICINEGTSTESNVAEFFKANGLRYKPVLFATQQEAAEAYDKGLCNVYTADKSALASFRLDLKKPKKHKILSDAISKEPLGQWLEKGMSNGLILLSGLWMH